VITEVCVTTATTGRSMSIHTFEALLRAARAPARTQEFKQAYPTRSNVERTVAHVATQNGRRIKLRHLGTEANKGVAVCPGRRPQRADPEPDAPSRVTVARPGLLVRNDPGR
jgi:hypothetical protein